MESSSCRYPPGEGAHEAMATIGRVSLGKLQYLHSIMEGSRDFLSHDQLLATPSRPLRRGNIKHPIEAGADTETQGEAAMDDEVEPIAWN